MGCCSSSAAANVAKKQKAGDDDNTLTDARKARVKETWEMAKGLGAETVGVLLFKNFFSIAPGAL